MLLPEVNVLVASGQVNQGVAYGMETATTRKVQSCSSD
jgi:hypothetical protein